MACEKAWGDFDFFFFAKFVFYTILLEVLRLSGSDLVPPKSRKLWTAEAGEPRRSLGD